MEDAHAKTVDEVLKYFNTNGEVGLTADQVKQYQAKYGPNGKFPSYLLNCGIVDGDVARFFVANFMI